ncbi:MAG: hypothetical protein ABF904_12480 [Ethanoligenens sp.]
MLLDKKRGEKNNWFEHGGTCLWSVNGPAKIKYNYPIKNEDPPISKALVDELYNLESEYHGYLDWNYPPNPSPWTSEKKDDFKNRANRVYCKLISKLGNDFEIINEIESCVR